MTHLQIVNRSIHMTKAEAALEGHRPGSAKGKVHAIYIEKGAEAAYKKAAALGKADSTARTWVSEWKNATGDTKKVAKKARTKAAKTSARKPVKAAKTSKGKKSPAKKAVKRERIAAEAATA
jgi:hypothetical protein